MLSVVDCIFALRQEPMSVSANLLISFHTDAHNPSVQGSMYGLCVYHSFNVFYYVYRVCFHHLHVKVRRLGSMACV